MISGSGKSPGEGNGYPLQYSCLENPRGTWQATVHKVAKSWTQLSDFYFQTVINKGISKPLFVFTPPDTAGILILQNLKMRLQNLNNPLNALSQLEEGAITP